jgi:chromosome segregation ATPase
MPVDCTSLEDRLNTLNKEMSTAAIEEGDVLQAEVEAQRALDAANGKVESLRAAVAAYEGVVKDLDRSVTEIEAAAGKRIDEYVTGLTELDSRRSDLGYELAEATDAAEIERINNNIAMTEAAIKEHELGVRQLEAGRDAAVKEMRANQAQVSADLASHQQQLQTALADVPFAERAAGAAADKARHAKARLARIRKDIDDASERLNECRERQRDERERSHGDGEAEPPVDDGSGWFRP